MIRRFGERIGWLVAGCVLGGVLAAWANVVTTFPRDANWDTGSFVNARETGRSNTDHDLAGPKRQRGLHPNHVVLASQAGLQAYWRMHSDPASQAMIDFTSNQNDLSFNGSVTSDATGLHETVAKFPGTASDFFSIADSAQTGLDGMTAFTAAMWIRPDTLAASTYYAMVAKDDAGTCCANRSYFFRVAWDAGTSAHKLQLFLGFSDNTFVLETGATTVPTNVWTCAVATYDGSAARVYFNGTEDCAGGCAAAATKTITNSARPFELGGLATLYPYNGMISDLSMWSRAWSAAEVADYCASGLEMQWGTYTQSDGTWTSPNTTLETLDIIKVAWAGYEPTETEIDTTTGGAKTIEARAANTGGGCTNIGTATWRALTSGQNPSLTYSEFTSATCVTVRATLRSTNFAVSPSLFKIEVHQVDPPVPTLQNAGGGTWPHRQWLLLTNNLTANPAANPNFESCTVAGDNPPNWAVSDAASTGCTQTSGEYVSGGWGVSTSSSGYIYQSYAVTAGQPYTVVVQAKVTSGTGTLRVGTAAGAGGTTRCSASITATSFTRTACDFRPTVNETVYINLLGSSAATYFDEVSIYPYAETSFSSPYTVEINLNSMIPKPTLAQADADDLRVARFSGGSWTELSRIVQGSSVFFPLQAAISAGVPDRTYSVFWGNATAGVPPATATTVFPVFADDFSSGLLTGYTTRGTVTATSNEVQMPASPPTLTNPGFESCTANGGAAPGWTVYGTGATVVCANTDVPTGVYRLAVATTTTGATASQTVTLKAYRDYQLSATVRVTAGTYEGKISLTQTEGDAGTSYCSQVTSSTTYVSISCTYSNTTASNITAAINLKHSAGSGGGARFDDVTLTEAGTSWLLKNTSYKAPDRRIQVVGLLGPAMTNGSAIDVGWCWSNTGCETDTNMAFYARIRPQTSMVMAHNTASGGSVTYSSRVLAAALSPSTRYIIDVWVRRSTGYVRVIRESDGVVVASHFVGIGGVENQIHDDAPLYPVVRTVYTTYTSTAHTFVLDDFRVSKRSLPDLYNFPFLETNFSNPDLTTDGAWGTGNAVLDGYFGMRSRLYKSADGGLTASPLCDLKNGTDNTQLRGIYEASDARLYLAKLNEGIIYKSSDAGSTCPSSLTGAPAGSAFMHWTMDEDTTGRVFAGTYGSPATLKVYRLNTPSTNTWEEIHSDGTGTHNQILRINRDVTPNEIYRGNHGTFGYAASNCTTPCTFTQIAAFDALGFGYKDARVFVANDTGLNNWIASSDTHAAPVNRLDVSTNSNFDAPFYDVAYWNATGTAYAISWVDRNITDSRPIRTSALWLSLDNALTWVPLYEWHLGAVKSHPIYMSVPKLNSKRIYVTVRGERMYVNYALVDPLVSGSNWWWWESSR